MLFYLMMKKDQCMIVMVMLVLISSIVMRIFSVVLILGIFSEVWVLVLKALVLMIFLNAFLDIEWVSEEDKEEGLEEVQI